MRRWIVLLLSAGILSGCAVINVPLTLEQRRELREYVVRPAERRFVTDKILLLDISGLITSEQFSGWLGEQTSTVADVRDALDKALKDRHIKAVVLRVDSPGGEVTASDIIYEQIKRFKQKRAEQERPVVVLASLLGQATSGAYYIALAADKIYAHPTCVTGAIGVTATFPDLSGLTRKIGVNMRVIKSADLKDLGSIWRDFSPEERRILQQTIDEMHQRFVRLVAENRSQLDRETVLRLADGRIYTARQAEQLGLVDGIAYLDEVIDEAKSLAGIRDADVITYKRKSAFEGSIYSRSVSPRPRATPNISLIQVNADGILGLLRRGGFYYLWLP